MDGKVTVIRMRWWGHGLVLLCLIVFPLLGTLIGSAGLDLLRAPDERWKGVLLLLGAAFSVLIGVMLLDILFTYRLEVDRSGLRIIGNFWRRALVWEEITSITVRPNARGIGYHVLIEVDGTRSPRRHWSHLWIAGYRLPTPMEKGPRALADFLKRKRQEALKALEAPADGAP